MFTKIKYLFLIVLGFLFSGFSVFAGKSNHQSFEKKSLVRISKAKEQIILKARQN